MISRADLSRPVNQGVSSPRGARPLRTRARERLPWAYLAAFFLGTALVSTFIWYQIESERQVVLANWQARVTAIAEGRARLVSDWFNARRADADVLAASPSVRAFVLEGGSKGGDVRSALVPQLDRVATAYGYSGISLMDTQGRTLARSTGASDPGRESAEAVLLAVRNRAMRADLVEEASRKLLVISAPIFAATRWIAPAGWGLVLKVDREEALADFYQAGKLAGLAGAFLTLALAGVLISLWRQSQRAALLREQMKQERAIFNLKGYAEKIVASVPSGLLLLSADLRVLSANRSFLESFFLRRDDVVGHALEDVVRAEGLLRRAREVMQSGVAQPDMLFELHLLHRRETRPVRVTMTGIRIEEQEEARLLLIIEDLTEEERLQSARLASEQRFQDLVQGLDAIVWEADAASLRFSFVSQRAQTIFGFPTERWLEQPSWFSERIHPEDRAKVMAQCRAALTRGEDHELEYRALTASGEIVWLRGLTVDLTELKHADEALRTSEDHLRQAQKMDAVGKLAGGIAHDFNNLLMVIRGDSDLMLRRLPPIHPLRKNAEGIREAADQAATLTRQLLAFSRKQVLAPKVLELNSIVAGMQTMLQRLIGETINLVVVPEPTLGRVKADPGQIEQVMMNLAVNARDAMPDGGRLMIRTVNVHAGEVPPPPGGAAAAPGPHVMLEVSDTGTGMDANTQAHLFEPFFTTKEQGKGTGLGLSTVYGVVEQSGGSIAVDTELGRGTTFRIYLPQVDAPVQPRESPVVPASHFSTGRSAAPAPAVAASPLAAVASTTAPPPPPRVAQAPALNVSGSAAATTPGSPAGAAGTTPTRP